MAKKQEKEIERWVTVNGARVPIFKDGSIGGPKALRDKVKATQDKKTSAKNYENKSFNGMVLDMEKDGLSIADTGNTGRGGLKDGETLSVYDKNTKQYHKATYHKDKNGKSSIDIQKKKETKNFESMNSVELSSIDLKKLSDDEFSKLHKIVKNKYPDKLGLRSKIIEESNRRFFEKSKASQHNKPTTKEKQIARNKKEADERNGKTKESYEPYEPQDAEEWAQDLYDSDNYVGDEHIEEQLERELHGMEGAKRYDIEDYEVIRNEDGGRYGDVKVRYALEFEDGLEHREGVYRLRVRDLPAGSKEEEAYKARIAKKKNYKSMNATQLKKAYANASSKKEQDAIKEILIWDKGYVFNTKTGEWVKSGGSWRSASHWKR